MRGRLSSFGWLAAGAVLVLAAVSPALFAEYGVHSDYRLGDRALVGDLVFGHIESFHLVRVGRILNALLTNVQWRLIASYDQLGRWRVFAAVLLVFSFLAVALLLRRGTRLSPARAALVSLSVFLMPCFTVNVYIASLFVPGAVTLAYAVGVYMVQRELLGPDSHSPVRLAAWLVVTLPALIVGHFLYTPSTAMFLALAAIHLVFGPPSPATRRTAGLELGVYVLAALAYFAVQQEIVFPWALRTLSFGSAWTDPEYDFAIALPGTESIGFLGETFAASANVWNAFAGIDVAWLVTAVLLAGLVRALWRSDAAGRHHLLFSAGFFVACFGMGVAPLLVSHFHALGYRILTLPMLLIGIALLAIAFDLVPQADSAPRQRREGVLVATVATFLGGLAFATMSTAVGEARAEIECLERFLLHAPPLESIALLEESPGGSRLRFEFSERIREAGPLDEFGYQVIETMTRRGMLAPNHKGLSRTARAVTRNLAEEAARGRRSAVLDVGIDSCSCIAGSVCQLPPQGD